MPTQKTRFTEEIQDWDEAPAFASEAEEATYWETHRFGDGILSRMEPADDPLLPPVRVSDSRSAASISDGAGNNPGEDHLSERLEIMLIMGITQAVLSGRPNEERNHVVAMAKLVLDEYPPADDAMRVLRSVVFGASTVPDDPTAVQSQFMEYWNRDREFQLRMHGYIKITELMLAQKSTPPAPATPLTSSTSTPESRAGRRRRKFDRS